MSRMVRLAANGNAPATRGVPLILTDMREECFARPLFCSIERMTRNQGRGVTRK